MADAAIDPTAEVLRLILEGRSAREIDQRARHLWPDRASEPLIIAALRELEASADKPPLLLAFASEAAREVYRRALEGGNMACALRAIKVLLELEKRKDAAKAGTDNGMDLAILDVG
jgi:hypothetical protein